MSNMPELPRDLVERGFHLTRLKESGRFVATSPNRGGSFASHDLETVIKSARAIAHWCEQQEKR